MKNPFQIGQTLSIQVQVQTHDAAKFETGQVHPVYATFALARDMEWASRQFVLLMLEPNEEGIGTFLEIQHHSPALVGEEVSLFARLDAVMGHEIICTVVAKVGNRTIATGKTGQKIFKKEKIAHIFASLSHE
jgi:fluoroacetyl-CoA thioesterase